MKKLMLVILVTGSCMMATAQNPDTSTRFNNALPPDTTAAPVIAPVEAAPGTINDTTQVVPNEPMSTDVRKSQPIVDTSAAQVPVATPTDSSATTAASVPQSSYTAVSNAPAVLAQETVVPQQNTQTNNHNMLPRGVNNSGVAITGLDKWSALPLSATYIPQDVVDRLKTKYGDRLYDITMLKTGEHQYGYSARIQENGIYSTVMLNDSSNAMNQ